MEFRRSTNGLAFKPVRKPVKVAAPSQTLRTGSFRQACHILESEGCRLPFPFEIPITDKPIWLILQMTHRVHQMVDGTEFIERQYLTRTVNEDKDTPVSGHQPGHYIGIRSRVPFCHLQTFE